MSQRWLKFLEKFGLLGETAQIPLEDEDLKEAITNPQMFERYDVLFHLYGPLPDSPWAPYHCPTLFASIDKLDIKPKTVEPSDGYKGPHPPTAWQWLSPDTMVIVDLPGSIAIEVGVTLMKMKGGAQFVSTFDHWAFARRNRTAQPVIDNRKTINMMFTLAPEVHQVRQNIASDVAPIWLCDSRRLGDDVNEPTPGMFDNRYYIDDSILPGINTLKKGGIRRIVHVHTKLKDEPLPDLVPFVIAAMKQGLDVEHVALDEESTWSKPETMAEPFETKLPIRSFRRTDLGGFGKMVPQPSEGGYGSGGGGG